MLTRIADKDESAALPTLEHTSKRESTINDLLSPSYQ
jgi:hypothetical protein